MRVSKYTFVSTQIEGEEITRKQWNKFAETWSKKTLKIQRNRAKKFTSGKDSIGQVSSPHTYKKGKKAGQTEYKLSAQGSGAYIFKLRHQDSEYYATEFKPPVHGIFREYGVGNGQPRKGGVRKIQKKRTESDWISYTITKNADELADKAAEYIGDKVLVNAFGIKTK